MAIIIDWPANLKPNHALIPYIENNTTSSGSSVTGIERLVSTDAGRWRYGFRVPIKTQAEVLSWRALMALTETRANIIRVPIEDCRYDVASTSGIRAAVRSLIPDAGIPHSDGALHSDGSGYSQSFVTGKCIALASQGSTAMTMTLPVGAVPQIGQMFSNGDNLYRVKSARLVSGATYTLKFEPRLRSVAATGSEFRFDDMSCLMRFSYDAVSRVEMQLLKFTDLELDFVEAVI